MKGKIAESKLLKAMAEIEEYVGKGDALEDADPEGGLATEGEPLSGAAPSGRGEGTKKSRQAASRSMASSADSASDGDSESDAAPPKPMKSKKKEKDVKKAAPPPFAASSSSDDSDSSDDDDSSDDESSEAEKSFRQTAERDPTVEKAIVVNQFLEALVDQISLAFRGLSKSLTKSLKEVEDRLSARIDDTVAKSSSSQQQFNVRMAKAISAIGNTVQDDLLGMVDMVKSLADQPVAPRGKAVLSKSEVNQPPWGRTNADQRLASGSGDYVEELREVPSDAINDWLFKGVARGTIDQKLIFAFEADHYDPESLPPQIRKAIVNDLIK